MAISNKFGPMVITTGNKFSEVSVGYATLYGDMDGGFNPVKDLYKTEVYRLARWRNEHHPKGALGRTAASSPRTSSSAHPRPTPQNPKNQIHYRPTRRSTTSWKCLVEGEMRIREVVTARCTTKRRSGRIENPSSTSRMQAPPGGARREDHAQEFRPSTRPRYPITNRFRDRR